MGRSKIDLTGKIINGIMVIGNVEEKGGTGKHIRWKCICPVCKNEFITGSQHLNGKVPISMCAICSRMKYNDLSGNRFGKLVVLHRDYEVNTKRISYVCRCDCGSVVTVQANHLTSKETISCGCVLSSGEETIARYLVEHAIKYERQKVFDGCSYEHPLRFDFFLPDYNLVIEYQGEQHYKSFPHFGGIDGFNIRKTRDEIKRKYCKDNNINYSEIKYCDNIEDSLKVLLLNEEMVYPYGNIVG